MDLLFVNILFESLGWVFCDVKPYIIKSNPSRVVLLIPPEAGVRSTHHMEVNWLHVWVVLRRCYYIEHTVVTTVVVNT